MAPPSEGCGELLASRRRQLYARAAAAPGARCRGRGYGVHPALLDAVLHAIETSDSVAVGTDAGPLLPFAWTEVDQHATGARELRAPIVLEDGKQDDTRWVSIEATDALGLPVARASLELRRAAADELRRVSATAVDNLYRVEWVERLLPEDLEAAWDSGSAIVLGGDGQLARGLGLPHTTDPAILREGEAPRLVLVDATAGDLAPVPAAVERALQVALATLQLHLAAADRAETALWWVTRGSVALDGHDGPVNLVHAPLRGLLRESAGSEHPDRNLRLVDLCPRTSLSPKELARAALLSSEPEIALRQGKLYVPRLARVASASGATPLPINPRGTVLVTGGSGELGQLVCRHLVAAHGVRRLLLVGRRGREGQGVTAPCQALASLGAQVEVASCDVTERTALARVLSEVPAEHPLTAVVHLAGVLDDGVATGLTAEQPVGARCSAATAPTASRSTSYSLSRSTLGRSWMADSSCSTTRTSSASSPRTRPRTSRRPTPTGRS